MPSPAVSCVEQMKCSPSKKNVILKRSPWLTVRSEYWLSLKRTNWVCLCTVASATASSFSFLLWVEKEKQKNKTGPKMLPCELYPRVNESTLLMNAADAARWALHTVRTPMSSEFCNFGRSGQPNGEWLFFVVIFICRMPSREHWTLLRHHAKCVTIDSSSYSQPNVRQLRSMYAISMLINSTIRWKIRIEAEKKYIERRITFQSGGCDCCTNTSISTIATRLRIYLDVFVYLCLYMHLNGQGDVMMGLMNAVAPLHIRFLFFFYFYSLAEGNYHV